MNEALHRVTVHSDKARLFPLAFQFAHKRCIQLPVQQEDVVALGSGGFNMCKLRLAVVGVEADEVAVFVGLRFFRGFTIFVVGVVLAFDVFEQGKVFGLVVEILF